VTPARAGWAERPRHRAPERDRQGSRLSARSVPAEPRNATIQYPGGIRARWRWANSGQGEAVFALTETGGSIIEHGSVVGPEYEQLCRAELRVDGPRGAWTGRFASRIFDDPRAIYWDVPGLLVVAYGFHTYGLDAGTGERHWEHRSASPIIALIGSSRLAHVIVQAEIETFALEADGEVAWRVTHSDVVTDAELVGGQLVLTGFSGQVTALDPASGRSAG
jgi:outer membrane protein assembly factor BamB